MLTPTKPAANFEPKHKISRNGMAIDSAITECASLLAVSVLLNAKVSLASHVVRIGMSEIFSLFSFEAARNGVHSARVIYKRFEQLNLRNSRTTFRSFCSSFRLITKVSTFAFNKLLESLHSNFPKKTTRDAITALVISRQKIQRTTYLKNLKLAK